MHPECLETKSCTVGDICDSNSATPDKSNDSIYCNIVKAVYPDGDESNVDPKMCSVKSGQMLNSITADYPVKFLGITIFSARTVTDQAFSGIFKSMLKLLMFAILFHHLIGAVLNFIEPLLGVYGISGMTPSYAFIARGAAKGVSMAISAQTGGVSKLAEQASKKLRS